MTIEQKKQVFEKLNQAQNKVSGLFTALLSDAKKNIALTIFLNPGINQKQIIEKLDFPIGQPVCHKHLNQLKKEGYIRFEKVGNSNHYYTNESFLELVMKITR